MANIKVTDNELGLFGPTDPYRYDVDNRPLRNLGENDVVMNAELEATTTEVQNARSDSSTGATVVYGSLDARLEALGAGSAGNASVSYAIFQSQADRNRATFQSGWLVQPTGKSYYGLGGYSGDDFGGLFGSQWQTATTHPNTLFISNDFDGQYLPLPLYVNGWMVKLINTQAGAPSANGQHSAVKLTAPPISGGRQDFVFLEVWLKEISALSPVFWFYGTPQYGAATYGENTPVLDGNYTTNPLDPRVVHSLTKLPNGNWLQVQHRIRLASGVSPTDSDNGFTGANANIVFGQGSQTSPVNGKSFSNMLSELGDAGLYRAGNGPSDSAALGTYDGHVYAVPIAMVHRRSTEEFTQTNQNGSKVVGNPSTGYMSSGISGRPDGLYYDSIDRRDFVDMRHWVDVNGVEFERLMQKALSEVLHGTSRLQWAQLSYSAGSQPVWGNRVLTNDVIFSDASYPAYASDPTLGSNVNYIKDGSRTGQPFSLPDGVRRRFDSYPVEERFEFLVNPFTLTSNQTIPGFITVSNPGGSSRSVTVNPTVLSGSTANTVPAGSPIWYWLSDSARIEPTVSGSSASRVYTFDVGSRLTTDRVLCAVEILFPAKSGTKNLPSQTVAQEFFDGALTHKSFSAPVTSPYWVVKDGDNKLWVAEYFSNTVSVWVEGSDGSLSKDTASGHILNSATVTNWATDGFSYPTSVAVWGSPFDGGASGAVWVADSLGRRVRKYVFNAGSWSLSASIQTFTVEAVSRRFGSDNPGATVGSPHGLAVTSDGLTLYVLDSLRHVVYEFSTTDIANATILAGVIDSPGTSTVAPVKLNNPTGISLDGTNVVITDLNNNRSSILDNTGTPVVTFVNSEAGSQAMPSNATNGDHVLLIGTPGSADIKYLINAGAGQTPERPNCIFKLDKDFNIEAIFNPFQPTDLPNRLGGIAVDDLISPNYVWVGARTYHGVPTGGWVLNYSNLSVAKGPTVSGFGDFRFYGLRHIPAAGSAPARLFAARYLPNTGFPVNTIQYAIGAGGALTYAAAAMFPSGVTQCYFSSYSQMRNVSGTYRFYENMVVDNFATRVYRWIASGSAWVRDASPVITLNPGDALHGAALGIDQDLNGNVYLSFPGVTDAGVSHVVHRYKWDGANLVAPGGVGNTDGVHGIDGEPGSTRTQLATPSALAVSYDGTALIVSGKTATGWVSPSEDIARTVPLSTDDADWQTGGDPYLDDVPHLRDSGNTPGTVATPIPGGVFSLVNNQQMYILTNNHMLLHYQMSVLNDRNSYQLVGEYGVYNEAGGDHGRLNSPRALVQSSASSDRVIIADTGAGRLMSIHKKMAGVSTSSGNIGFMTPLLSTERLKIWSVTNSYQGVGSKVFANGVTERVFASQIVAASEMMYITSLGRSPTQSVVQVGSLAITAGGMGGAIDRLPLGGKYHGLDSSNFDSVPLSVLNVDPSFLSSPILKLPINTIGLTSFPEFADDANEDSILTLVRRDAGLTESRANRGLWCGWGNGQATTFSAAMPLQENRNHLVFLPYLIRRQGRMYLLIISQINTGVRNSIGDVNAYAYAAMDLFEVPGRLLMR